MKDQVNIKTIKSFFENKTFKNKTIRLNQAEVVTDIDKFIKSHIQILEANKGKSRFLPYYERLLTLYKTLKNGSK